MALGTRVRSGAASNGLTTGRAVAVLAVVVGCLGVLWPKIFYPMLMVALRGTDGEVPEYPPPMTPRGPMAGRLQQSGKRVPPPQARMPVPGPQGTIKGVAKTSSFNFIMPIYTLGIIIVFVYMIFKIMSRGEKENVDLDRLAYNERSQLAQRAMAAKSQNNNFDPPKRNRKDPRNAFENNTKMVLRMYGKDKMLDALNVVVNEMHEYKKQAIQLAKQLEEHQQKSMASSTAAANEDEVDMPEISVTATQNEDAASDNEQSGDEVDQGSDDSENGRRLDPCPSEDPENDIDDDDFGDGLPSEAPSEQDSDESEKDIDTQLDEGDSVEVTDEVGQDFSEVSNSYEAEDEEYGDYGTSKMGGEWRHEVDGVAKILDSGCVEKGEYLDEDQPHVEERNEVEFEPRKEELVFENEQGSVHEGLYENGAGDVRVSAQGDEDDNDAEIEKLFCAAPQPRAGQAKKVTADKSVYARHPRCLCSTPPADDEVAEVHGSTQKRQPLSASTIDDICRNEEGLQFLDHATEIEPGTKLQCYDDVIYGHCVTERSNEENGNAGHVPENGLQILQDFIAKDREAYENRVEDTPQSDYQQWKAITPEDLFKTASAVVEKASGRNVNNWERNSRPHRNVDRANGNHQNGPRHRPPPQNFYYEDSAVNPRAPEDNAKVRRRPRRARRAD